jgi:hypothetical protein
MLPSATTMSVAPHDLAEQKSIFVFNAYGRSQGKRLLRGDPQLPAITEIHNARNNLFSLRKLRGGDVKFSTGTRHEKRAVLLSLSN